MAREERAQPKAARAAKPKPGTAAGRGRTAGDAYKAISGAQRELTEAANRISAELNDAHCKAYRSWVASHHNTHADFLDHLDRDRLQQELQAAGEAYWNEVRDLTEAATQRLADTHQGYLTAIKEAVAAIDVKNVDSCTLTFLAQTLNGAAALASQQQPASRAA